ncbi:MAG TPA: ABC transporter permease [Gemmataceae bacterium]|nr:ABC transporter permease [Gemmataceae bacterium]
MSSKTVLEPREEPSVGNDWQPAEESMPSVMKADEPRLARWIGTLGLTAVLIGGIALIANASGQAAATIGVRTLIGPGLATFLLVMGFGGLLFHAANDFDLQVRRTYMGFAFLCLGVGILVSVLKVNNQFGFLFLPYGLIGLVVGLLFLMAFTRHETEGKWLNWVARITGGIGILAALIGFIGGNLSTDFLIPQGIILLLIGLAYWWRFIGLTGTFHEMGYYAALGMGGVGLIAFLVALVRSAFPGLLQTTTSAYLMPGGLLLMGFGLLYMALGAGLVSDNRLVVQTRRELAAIFYSPIAYIVLFGFIFIGWHLFGTFVLKSLWQPDPVRGIGGVPRAVIEPIVGNYFVAWFPVICVIFVIPVLTMRLLSEEKRTGTMEVMLTAPLSETTVVLSKFLAAFFFYILLWIPWGLYLVALRVEGGQPFDYRPILGFFVAVIFTGATFVSMGLFFSSLTQNQVAAAILTFVGMFVLTAIFILKGDWLEDDARRIVLDHISYIDLWINSLDGRLQPRDLVYNISATFFWLFLSVKVLESRKWR